MFFFLSEFFDGGFTKSPCVAFLLLLLLLLFLLFFWLLWLFGIAT